MKLALNGLDPNNKTTFRYPNLILFDIMIIETIVKKFIMYCSITTVLNLPLNHILTAVLIIVIHFRYESAFPKNLKTTIKDLTAKVSTMILQRI